MNQKPSQDLAKQSAELKRKIQAQEQELLILQNTTQAAKNQWDDQKRRIAKETLLKIEESKQAISDSIDDADKILATKLDMIARAEVKLKNLDSLYEVESTAYKTDLDKLERQKKVLAQTNSTFTADNVSIKSEISANRDEVNSLKNSKDALNSDISTLIEQQKDISDQVFNKTHELNTLKEQINATQEEFETEKVSTEKDISILEAKLRDQSEKIMSNRAQDDKVRENLADWQHKLEQRDKNLRIREIRVEQGEAKLIQNADLLNL